MSRPRSAAVLSALFLVGCQVILVTDKKQCASNADCVAKGGANLVCVESVCRVPADAGLGDAATDGGEPWACLANPPGKPLEDRSKLLIRRNRYVVYSQDDCEHKRPVPDMGVKLCSQRDVACLSPVETARSDCDGYFNLTAVYVGFEGYLLLTPPRPQLQDGATAWSPKVRQCFQELAAKEAAEGKSQERCAVRLGTSGEAIVGLPPDLMPGIEMLVPPPSTSDDPASSIPPSNSTVSFSENTLRSLTAAIGLAFDPNAGHLAVSARDCADRAAAGVAITLAGGIGPTSQVFYTDAQGLPNTNQGETSTEGDTGYLNLDAGPTGLASLSVTATRQSTRERVGVYAALIRSGHSTIFNMAPLKN
ncbi:MAG: hypothetical protein IPG50_39140 [Myxococcales bacterium]|nr:hypothetical protein [Myxococcales bacterium]